MRSILPWKKFNLKPLNRFFTIKHMQADKNSPSYQDVELLDVLNEKGEFTGISKPRGEIHKLGLYHKAIHCWIINSKGEMLIQKRSPLKKAYPNLWDISCAGHIEAGLLTISSQFVQISIFCYIYSPFG